ncbi:MAG TPA: class I SAM-dependent methyltransferase [Candidatus Baltobacteraceae bacterium]|nr:class I SAM-dependent methyltransferase [Candidatus Baltobacteraceae bacterium]
MAAIRRTSGKRSGQRFDATHGIITEALIFLGELDPDAIGGALEDATHYEPTPIAEFADLLAASGIPATGRTFVDVGAGMGRVVLLASLHPYKQIVGVEVSPALCATARDNVVRWRQKRADVACKDIRIVCRDATAFRFPPGDLVIYLYNPFGESTMQRLIDRLAQQTAGDVCVLYHTPVHRDLFDEHSAFECVGDLGFGKIYRKRLSAVR